MANDLPKTPYIEDSQGNKFVFRQRELPAEIPFPLETKLNKIEYPGGHRTNQVIGTYWKEVQWTGLFYGTYDGKTAWHRLLELQDFLGKVVTVYYPVPGFSGWKQEYIIESLEPKVRNYLNIEYTIRFVPHERQEKIIPKETVKVGGNVSIINVSTGLQGVQNNVKNADVVRANKDASTALTQNDDYLKSILQTMPGDNFRK